MIDRRNIMRLLGSAAVAGPLDAFAEQPAMPVIGFLGSASPDQWTSRLRAFRQGLSETGYVEGRNVAIEYRWADSQNDRLPALAAELVRRRVTVLVALGNTPSVLALRTTTTTIPIVFRVAVNPVEIGLAASLGQPGGNLTGVTTLGVEVGPKQLELLHELAPAAANIALLINPTNPVLAETQSRILRAAARTLGLELHILSGSTDRDFDAAFASLSQLRAVGLVIGADAFFNSRGELLAALAVRHAVPTISPYREFAEAGGLMSYGGGIADASRQVGVYTGRILKGEKPSDLPIQFPVKYEMAVNLKTAAALGLTMPFSIIARADEVIE